jgi:hypothetical protein
MAKGFGIAALVMAILAIFVPVAGVAISALAVLLAVIAGFSGDRGFAIATALISAINAFFVSPSLWMMQEGGPSQSRSSLVAIVAIAFFVVPIIGVVIGSSRKPSEVNLQGREPKF